MELFQISLKVLSVLSESVAKSASQSLTLYCFSSFKEVLSWRLTWKAWLIPQPVIKCMYKDSSVVIQFN